MMSIAHAREPVKARSGPFCKIPYDILGADLSARAKLAYAILLDRRNRFGYISLSNRQLAGILKCSPAAAYRCIQQLISQGWLTAFGRFRGRSVWLACRHPAESDWRWKAMPMDVLQADLPPGARILYGLLLDLRGEAAAVRSAQADLGRWLACSQQAVSRILGQLEQAGWIRPEPGSRRWICCCHPNEAALNQDVRMPLLRLSRSQARGAAQTGGLTQASVCRAAKPEQPARLRSRPFLRGPPDSA